MRVLVDTCFWIALFNPEKHADKINTIEIISSLIENHEIIIPYPTLYEFLNTKFSRKHDALNFQKLICRSNFIKLDDIEYREKALDNFFQKAIYGYNDVSLVDEIMKEIIDANKLKIDYIITFDIGLINHAISRGIKIP